jgi:hypothetical protein
LKFFIYFPYFLFFYFCSKIEIDLAHATGTDIKIKNNISVDNQNPQPPCHPIYVLPAHRSCQISAAFCYVGQPADNKSMMADQCPNKNDIVAIFKRLRNIPANKVSLIRQIGQAKTQALQNVENRALL